MGQLSPRWLIFLHLPRTAGTTFVRILERQYGADAVLDVYDSTFGEEVAARTELEQVCVITGHFYFGIHTHLSGPCRYVTFLRDPVERVVSHYHFVRRHPDHYLYPTASTSTLAEYVTSCGAAEPNNDQARLLAGRDLASSDGTWSPEMLPAAIQNLDDLFTIGLTEDFDASLIAMQGLFGWRRPFYVPQNIGARANDTLPSEIGDLIRAYNALDVELYKHARERVEVELARHGPAFARRVQMFKRLNSLYGVASRVAQPR